VDGIDTYDDLPSTPDSLAREPLLAYTPEDGETPSTPKNSSVAAANGDQPGDYFGGASTAQK